MSDANKALSSDTGGRRIGLTNDFSRPLQGVMADASYYYLLGYESPATTADGKFRKIDVDVRTERRTRHRAQRLLGAAARRLRTAAAAAAGRRSRPRSPKRSIRSGTRRAEPPSPNGLASGRWTRAEPGDGRVRDARRRATRRRSAPSSWRSRCPTASSRHFRRSRGRPACGPLRFAAPPGRLRTRASVKNAAGEEMDNWARDTIVPAAGDSSQVGTPVVYRPASVAAVPRADGGDRRPAVSRRGDSAAPIARSSAWRWGAPAGAGGRAAAQSSGHAAADPGRRCGADAGEVQVELPLGNLAFADYVLRFTVTLPEGKANRLVPFTLAP